MENNNWRFQVYIYTLGILTGLFLGLIVVLIVVTTDINIKCDLGDNKTLEIELEDNEFIPPDDESIKSCKVIM